MTLLLLLPLAVYVCVVLQTEELRVCMYWLKYNLEIIVFLLFLLLFFSLALSRPLVKPLFVV